MPQRTDIQSILILGAGPIVIGQACEFDYSGTQACQILKKLGYRIILVNSNPATIMTDPDGRMQPISKPLSLISLKRSLRKNNPMQFYPPWEGKQHSIALWLYTIEAHSKNTALK